MRFPWGYLLVFEGPVALVAGGVAGATIGPFAAWAALPLIVTFLVMPAMDRWLGDDPHTPPERPAGPRPVAYRWLPLSCLPVQLALVIWAAAVFTGQLGSPLGALIWLLSTGVVGAVLAINVAHELIHKSSRLEQWSGGLLLATVAYGGFKVEHIRGHHVHVATPADSSTARRGESVYRFIARAFARNPVQAWRLEARRLRRKGRHPLSWRNELLWWHAASLALLAGLCAAFGIGAGIFFLGQAAVAIASLEIINYIEHYGLQRRRLADGRLEPPGPAHAWAANARVSNRILFQLPRHADHHEHPLRPYEALRHVEESPRLPGGYPAMFLLALVPPLWWRAIHPRLDSAAPGQAEPAASSR